MANEVAGRYEKVLSRRSRMLTWSSSSICCRVKANTGAEFDPGQDQVGDQGHVYLAQDRFLRGPGDGLEMRFSEETFDLQAFLSMSAKALAERQKFKDGERMLHICFVFHDCYN